MKHPNARSSPGEAGISLIEVLVCAVLLVLTCLSLVHAYTALSRSSKQSARALVVAGSIDAVSAAVVDVPFDQLLAWNGTRMDRGDHSVNVATNLLEVGLILVEFIVTDDNDGAVLGRVATLRSEV